MTNKYSHMHLVEYKSIPNWSAGYILGHDLGFTEKYPLARIGDFIHPAKNAVVVEDDKEYKQVTLKTNGGGAVLRGVMKGSSIGTKKQFLAKEGQFVMSKIDARNGAFGIISKELNGAIVTGDFPLFDVNRKLISTEYLFLISTTKSFVRFAQSCSRGTTNRRRIDVNLFLQQQIPLPSLEEQKALVDAYQETQKLAFAYDLEGTTIDIEIINYIRKILGITTKKQLVKQGLYFIHSKDVKLWDFESIMIDNSYSAEYPLVPFVSLLSRIEGASTKIKENEIKEVGQIPVITQEKNRLIAGYTDNKNVITDLPLVVFGDHSCSFKYVDFQFVRGADGTKLLKFNEKCNPEFFAYFLPTVRIDNQDKYQRHYKYLEKIKVPLPPLTVQQEIVDEVQKRRAEIKSYREHAAQLRKEAIIQFEQAIFE